VLVEDPVAGSPGVGADIGLLAYERCEVGHCLEKFRGWYGLTGPSVTRHDGERLWAFKRLTAIVSTHDGKQDERIAPPSAFGVEILF
jgi:hypothetical protein